MAISAPTERQAQNKSGQGTSTTVSPTGTIVVGSNVILCATSSTGGKVISAISDDAGGNTWNIDATHAPAQNLCVSFASCRVVTQITSSTVITMSWAVTTNNQINMWLQEVPGLARYQFFDRKAIGSGTNTIAATPFTTAASPSLSQPEEIVFVGARVNDVTGWTKEATYSDVATPTLNFAGLEYKIVASTDAVSGSATHSNTSSFGMLLVTYRGERVPRNPAENFQDPAYV